MSQPRVTTLDIWTFAVQPPLANADLVGYSVEATDGMIGKVDEATYDTGGSYLVIDAGPWIYGNKTVVVPAGAVERIDQKIGTVFINRTQEEIANAPEYDEKLGHRDAGYRERIGDYYRK